MKIGKSPASARDDGDYQLVGKRRKTKFRFQK